MMKASGTSETSVNFHQTTRVNTPEDINLYCCIIYLCASFLNSREAVRWACWSSAVDVCEVFCQAAACLALCVRAVRSLDES
jgi:hypothetical protein